MAFEFVGEGVAASIFLALYLIYTLFTIGIVWHKGTLRTIYAGLLFFGMIRMGAQLCGIAFASLGYEHWQWLVAYLVLGAEGYFVLILTSFYMVSHAHIAAKNESWLKTSLVDTSSWRLLKKFKINGMNIFYYLATVANVLVIVGGTMLTGLDADEYDANASRIETSKGLRGTGQAMFLIFTLVVAGLAAYTVIHDNIRSYLLTAVFIATPFLFVRGIYGLLSCFIQEMNYFSMANYTATGMSVHFVATEYVLATTMEFISACIFMSTYYVVYMPKKTLSEDETNLIEVDGKRDDRTDE
ncbi:BA75_00017T0 [Komagataella pastoris]|uniref:BA75_00017T0 n=1 Tax=Komagataella pastoris TaxID=4922 RepID=A0A1B2J6B0_PICPA|nr:BA75_00017T0 [Komagataella pastoris]